MWRSLLLDSATNGSSIGDDGDDVDDRVTEDEQDASQSNQELHAHLAAVDASMAAKLHVNDRRKVLRSLQVYRFFGRAHSDLLAEQRAAPADMLRYRALMFNLWAQEEPLGKRLDGRVDAMLERGLRAELLAFRERIRDDAQRADTTHGVFQAIGYKEFMPLFDAIERRVEDIDAIEE